MISHGLGFHLGSDPVNEPTNDLYGPLTNKKLFDILYQLFSIDGLSIVFFAGYLGLSACPLIICMDH